MEIIASKFKAECLHLMEEVARTGEPIIITKHGKPIAQLTSIKQKPEKIFGALKHVTKIKGDILSPIDIDWSYNQDGDLL